MLHMYLVESLHHFCTVTALSQALLGKPVAKGKSGDASCGAMLSAQASAQQLQSQGRDNGEVSVAHAHEQVSVSPTSFNPCPVLSWE